MKIAVPKTLLYDFKRTLKSKSVITIMALPIVISFAIIPFTAPQNLSPGSNINVSALLYYDRSGSSGSYHFLAYSSNQYGQPISGTTVQFNLSDTQGNIHSSPKGTTNSSGYSLLTINAPVSNNYFANGQVTAAGGQFTYMLGQQALRFYASTSKQPQNLSSGQILPLFGGFGPFSGSTFSIVVDNSNASKRNIQLFYAGSNGTRPSYGFYYKAYNYSSTQFGPAPLYFNQSQMQLIGQLTNYHQIYTLNLPKNDTCSNAVQQVTGPGQAVVVSCNIQLYLELFSQNGTLVQSSQIPADQLYPPPQPPVQASSAAIQFFSTIMNVFIPLMAIVGSYSSYGKDRISGVLESVLSRPVSRRGLGISRYLSTFLALAVAVAISMSVVDALLKVYTGSFLDTSLILGAAGSFLVEVAAFVGLMFLFSHLFKSTGLLIGIGIGLFVALDLFWIPIIFILTSALGATFNSAVYLQVAVFADFLNPIQFITLVYAYLTNQFIFGFIQPSTYGITIPTLVLTAILWIAFPFSLFLYRAVKKD